MFDSSVLNGNVTVRRAVKYVRFVPHVINSLFLDCQLPLAVRCTAVKLNSNNE